MLTRRGFLSGLLASTAIAPVLASISPIYSGEIGVYEGVRIIATPSGGDVFTLEQLRRAKAALLRNDDRDYYALAVHPQWWLEGSDGRR